ncbi:MAG: DNA (cytosine-5-)-methyltransferase [Bacteroidetes bacterium]|jgi:DNA (cytosine-5)-methyltransferase 1|nr:DNA (cytosine-5-)-methyltransferase [Bacteroidota bacterium]
MRYIDLFAGAGGLSEGFIKAGFTPVAHVEMDRAACYTLKTRLAYHYLMKTNQTGKYIDYLKGKIGRDQLYSLLPPKTHDSVINATIGEDTIQGIFTRVDALADGKPIDVLAGGPPCQAYSVVGRARDANGMRNDPRNYLYKYYAQFLERYQPKAFVFENVLGLRTAANGKYFNDMKECFDKAGYVVADDLLKAREFGVLQDRKRILIIGWKKNLKIKGMPSFQKIGWDYTVADILGDLPIINSGEGEMKNGRYHGKATDYLNRSQLRNGLSVLTQHCARPHTTQDLKIYRIAVERWNKGKERLHYTDLPSTLRTHRNTTSFLDRFKVVAADQPCSHTVVAHIARDGHHYIHPDVKQNRSLSVREAARLQSFPDDFYFEGVKVDSPRTAAFKQIGNAVPPLMAESIAKAIKARL